MCVVKNADQPRQTADSRQLQAAQWEEPEFEFDYSGINLEGAAARQSSGKIR